MYSIYFKRLKSFSFEEPRLGKRFFIFAHPENFMCSALKSLNFGGPVWGKPPLWHPQFLLRLVYF